VRIGTGHRREKGDTVKGSAEFRKREEKKTVASLNSNEAFKGLGFHGKIGGMKLY